MTMRADWRLGGRHFRETYDINGRRICFLDGKPTARRAWLAALQDAQKAQDEYIAEMVSIELDELLRFRNLSVAPSALAGALQPHRTNHKQERAEMARNYQVTTVEGKMIELDDSQTERYDAGDPTVLEEVAESLTSGNYSIYAPDGGPLLENISIS